MVVKDGRKEKVFACSGALNSFGEVSCTVERNKNTLDNLISILKTSIDAGQAIITKIHGEIKTKR